MKLLLFLGTIVTLVHFGHLIPDFCRLPKDEGEGTNFGFAVYYDPTKDQCEPFMYKGQGGNANRFTSEKECIRNCSAKAESIYPMDLTKVCHLPKAKGTCSGNLLRYYYDSVYDRCKKFHYSGCFGNGNRFPDMNTCNATCDGVHDDREEEEDLEPDTPVAIICGVVLGLIVAGIIITVAVLSVMSKKKEAKKKGKANKQQDVPLQETTVEVSPYFCRLKRDYGVSSSGPLSELCGGLGGLSSGGTVLLELRSLQIRSKLVDVSNLFASPLWEIRERTCNETLEDSSSQEKSEENSQHCVCMDCTNYSIFCYKCDEFVVDDTALEQVQKLREHLQNLENSGTVWDSERKRKIPESDGPDNKTMKTNDGAALAATGLRNLGNTCFMNAILQSLSNIEQFSCYFKALPAAAQLSGKAAGRMYHTRSKGETSVSLVEEIMPCFRGYQQQDAHEFMRYLLDHLHRELQGRKNGDLHLSEDELATGDKACLNGNGSVVTSIFGGVLQNEVNCLICGTESRKFDPFLDLSLDIPRQFRQKKTKDQEPGPVCTLQGQLLQSFTDLEELDDTELYYCLNCKKRQKSTKKFWIKKLPKVLCLHLKRFHWTTFMRNKVDTYVKFPIKSLDMRTSCWRVGSGHYTAYGCHEGRWYHFNDSTVTLTSEETVSKAKAYILFYVESQRAARSELKAEKDESVEKESSSQDCVKLKLSEAASAPGQSAEAQGDTFSSSAVTQTHTSDDAASSTPSV
ncbi:hypothetical protein WMY93_023481 [Mugilogobius chulae]|uniref:ubiquitinyl hydrolase 1 n=1 Tax=Mugilogobius chulae TaxID=88201 RepID=A0AAW0NEW5_9GOBI